MDGLAAFVMAGNGVGAEDEDGEVLEVVVGVGRGETEQGDEGEGAEGGRDEGGGDEGCEGFD